MNFLEIHLVDRVIAVLSPLVYLNFVLCHTSSGFDSILMFLLMKSKLQLDLKNSPELRRAFNPIIAACLHTTSDCS
jgi:hypothetical protein